MVRWVQRNSVSLTSFVLTTMTLASCLMQMSAALDGVNLADNDELELIPEEAKRGRFSGFRSDLGKRSEVKRAKEDDGSEIGLARSAYLADLSKRARMFRSDLGRRSSDRYQRPLGYGENDYIKESEWLPKMIESSSEGDDEDVEKRRYMFRSDLGKRPAANADAIRRMFRADLGKRRMFRHDLG